MWELLQTWWVLHHDETISQMEKLIQVGSQLQQKEDNRMQGKIRPFRDF